MDYVEAFRRLVEKIEAVHGASRAKVMTPQLKLHRVSAVWFIDGDNHGIHVDGNPSEGAGPRVEAWGSTGSVGFVVLVPPGRRGARVLTLEHLENAARLVGLLPAENVP